MHSLMHIVNNKSTYFIERRAPVVYQSQRKFHRKIINTSCNKMKFLVFVVITLNLFCVTFGQQCRYVTVPVCDGDIDEPSGGNSAMATKGDKGDRGFSGKIGPMGQKGENGTKGEFGQKGEKGSTASVVELQEHLLNRMNGRLTHFFTL